MKISYKIIISIFIILLIISCFFTPYIGIWLRQDANSKIFIGYYPIFSPPSPGVVRCIFAEQMTSAIFEVPLVKFNSLIDMQRLFIEFFGIILFTIFLLFINFMSIKSNKKMKK